MTVYWMVWDAAAHWVVDRLDAQGLLPSVRRLRESGVRAAARPPSPNCQTPPSLATLFTGTGPHEHGVTGFAVPAPEAGPGLSVSGFGPVLRRPAVWETAGAAGFRSTSVHAPWITDTRDDDGGVPGWIDGAVEAYSRRRARPGVHAVGPGRTVLEVAGHALDVDPVAGGVRVRGGRAATVVTDSWVPLALEARDGPDAPAALWLRLATVEGRKVLLHSGVWAPRTVGHDASVLRALRQAPTFSGDGLGPYYRDGRLGRRLVDGGDGSAEEVFLSSVDRVTAGFAGAVDQVLPRHRSDLVVMYLPSTDDVGHDLIGWCDERSGAFRPDVAPALWPHVARCYRRADELLGRVLRRAGPDDTVLLCADHGVAGTPWTVRPAQLLVDAGLSVSGPAGQIDLERSDCYYHPVNNGSVWVRPQAAPGVLQRVAEALAPQRVPGTGRPLVREVRPSADGRRADLLLDPDCLPVAGLAGDGQALHPSVKPGAHVTNGGDDRLHAVFAATGPGLAPGDDLGVIDNTWPAALVLGQLRASRPRATASQP
ncbi:alkaline phosphatase family protein [Kineosporia sp. J2-2]|uniref:Alkaline phosphatase family protein n=1 Tax=Kineosporia corallincola TaxID=2835133 RepID=A0ABS5TQJ6_9ACTN|nr:alkaline phosphatase family protein [Kineosporia corallincola]MBT0773335.1 alkaline phosphatase family protein [Kineosporia corallincola]